MIADVAPKVKARGIDFFCWDYNNAVASMNRTIPNFPKVTEIDVYPANLCQFLRGWRGEPLDPTHDHFATVTIRFRKRCRYQLINDV